MGCAGDLSEKENFDENSMINDKMSDLIGGYKSDESSIVKKYEVTVPVYGEIKRPEEEKYTYSIIVKRLN